MKYDTQFAIIIAAMVLGLVGITAAGIASDTKRHTKAASAPNYTAQADALMKDAGPPPRSPAAMCTDAMELWQKGDNTLVPFYEKHCRPAVKAPVSVDTVTADRARDCHVLRAAAHAGDPVAAYDYVQARKAGLCL